MDIMQAILEIEKKAQGIVDSIDDMKKNHSESISAETAKLESELEEKLKRRKDELRDEYSAVRDRAMTKIEREYADKLEKLDKKCEKNREKWTSEIVNAVIGE